jgi:hypothetical protein
MRLKYLAAVFAIGLPLQAVCGSTQGEGGDQDPLSQCIILHTTGADRILTARWMFAAMSKSPQMADLGAVGDQRKAELDKGFGRLLVRIVNVDCIDQVRPLAAANKSDAFGRVGEALGSVAMQELLGNKVVEKSLSAYVDYLSEDDFKPLQERLDKDGKKDGAVRR